MCMQILKDTKFYRSAKKKSKNCVYLPADKDYKNIPALLCNISLPATSDAKQVKNTTVQKSPPLVQGFSMS